MDVAAWHDALERDGEAMAAAGERGSLATPVPACPGWSLADLVHHAGEVLLFWTTIVRDEIDDPELIDMPSRPADDDLVAWFRAQLAEANRVLRTSDPAGRSWSWSHQPDVAFVIRRVAQEMGVHLWDALDATGVPTPIEPELASDGIDEFFEHFASWPKREYEDLGGTVHVHCTDVAGEWLTRQDAGNLVTTREHAKGSCALRGPASDLLLVLWRRRPLDSVDVIGDADVARRFVAWSQLN